MWRWTVVAILAAYAAVSVSAGARNAVAVSKDLAPLYLSSRLWLNGLDPYRTYTSAEWMTATGATAVPDDHPAIAYSTPYSPVSLVLLAPISWAEWPTAKLLWLLVNLALLPVVPWLIVRTWYPHWSTGRRAFLATLWLSGIGLRVGLGTGQHALFWFACLLGTLALVARGQRGIAGVALGLSVHKVHLTAFAAPFLLIRTSARTIAMSAAVVSAFLAVFVVHLDVPVRDVAASYVREIAFWVEYARGGGLPGFGSTHLHPVLASLIGTEAASAAMYALLALSLSLCLLAFWRRPSGQIDLELSTYLLLMLWSTYHAVYDTVVLILPIAALIDRVGDAKGQGLSSQRMLLGALMVMWLTDVSRALRLAGLETEAGVGLYGALDVMYRVLLVVAFGAFLRRVWSRPAV